MSYQSKANLTSLSSTRAMQNSCPVNICNSSVMSDSSRSNLLITKTRPTLRRYSLADTMPTSNEKQKNTYYHTYTSAKIDSKSPGYSTRVVQYNEHYEKPSQIHRGKYNKLGVFPIVHFFKKDLPHLKRKAHDASSQMTSSNLTKYNSPEHNWMLLEKIIKSNSGSQSTPHKNNSNPKSVLEALKEISRKRIRSSGEEFVLQEDGKETFVDYNSENSSSKRLKQNSHVETSITINSSSRFRSVDELLASHSSMDGYLSDNSKGETFDGNTNSQLELTTLPVKYVDVETQTIPQATSVLQSFDVEKSHNEIMDLNYIQRDTKSKKTSPVKIFDEAPLETMRKNRLSVLMGSLTSNKIHSTITEDTLKTGDSNKPLVSILSGPTKSPQKSNKHVTFDIPETVNSDLNVNTTDTFTVLNNSSESSKLSDGPHVITKTSAAMIMPIVSASVSKSVSPQKLASGNLNEIPSLPSYNDLGVSTQIQSSASTTVSYNLSTPTLHSHFNTNLNAKLQEKNDECVTKINGVAGQITNKAPIENALMKATGTQSSGTGSLSQNAGFKFELKEVRNSGDRKTISPFPFITSAVSSSTCSSLTNTKNNLTNLPNFGIPTDSYNRDTSVAFSLPTVTKSLLVSSFGSKSSPPNFVMASTASQMPSFSFGSSSTQKMVSLTFGSTSVSPVNTTASLTFPTTHASSSNFGVLQNTSLTSAAFDTPTGGFPTPQTYSSQPISIPSTTKTSSFGSANTSSFNKTLIHENIVSSLGNDGTSKSTIAQNTPLFRTAVSTFGTINNTMPSNKFANMDNNMFGNTSNFGTQVSSFGAGTVTNFGNDKFGENQNARFSSDLNNDVKNNSRSFGTPSGSTFGPNTNGTGFTSNVTTITTASTTFASNINFTQTSNAFSPTFQTTSPFDKSARVTEVLPFGTTNSIFGSNNLPANPQVSQNNVFAFGASNSSKPAVFSFGASEPPKTSFPFNPDNKSFGSTSSTFNASSRPFNVQPSGTNMFNIGAGSSAAPTRSRVQHKAKRRT